MLDESDDDMYGGFDDYNPLLDTFDIEQDKAFQKALQSSAGRRPPTAVKPTVDVVPPRTAVPPPTSACRTATISTAKVGLRPSLARPLSAMRGAGYCTSNDKSCFGSTCLGIKAIGLTSRSTAVPPLEKKEYNAPRERIRLLERKINNLVDDSCLAAGRKEYAKSLDIAKSAARGERQLQKEIMDLGGEQKLNKDLSYLVMFNLANQYELNHMWHDALKTYMLIVRDNNYKHGGAMRLNIGNIYLQQGNYKRAIKMYQMALDQTPEMYVGLRSKIRRNVGLACIKTGKLSEALLMQNQVMTDKPSFTSGLNLILTNVINQDPEGMKLAFQKLLGVTLHIDDEAYSHSEEKQSRLITEVIRNDLLRQFELEMKNEAESVLQLAVKVIAPQLFGDFAKGFDWCIERLKNTRYWDIVPSIEMAKAMKHLASKEVDKAIVVLKDFEGKETRVAAAAANNLSFVYNVEDNVGDGCKYAEMSLMMDQYNPCAFVNKGASLFKMKDYEKARAFFQEALLCDSSCYQALYNLGMCEKKMELHTDAIRTFYKLYNILRSDPLVVFQLADCYDITGDIPHAVDWFLKLKSMVPGDGSILQRLGQIYDKVHDKMQAFQYYYESFQCESTNLAVIEWLGIYYIESQFYEKAVPYFDKLSKLQPTEVQWRLAIANCYRRSGNYNMAIEAYLNTHRLFPTNVSCLRFLHKMAVDQNLPDKEVYARKLQFVELQLQQQGNDEKASGLPTDGKKAQRKAQDELRYKDPIGPQPVRPKTAARQNPLMGEFSDEDVEELLPD